MVTNAVRPDDVRKANRRRVIATLRRGGAMSRTDITAYTGLSAATVSAITSDLLTQGVLIQPEHGEQAHAGRGRPKVALGLNPDAALVGAVIFQLHSVSAHIIDYSGITVSTSATTIETLTAHSEALRSALVDCLEKALTPLGARRGKLRRMAAGVQGVTDVAGTMMQWSPITREKALPIAAWLEAAFSAPARLSNDCDMIARALNWRDPERYGSNFGAVLLDQGVGMGLYLRDTIINGTRSSGIEFGHMTHIPGGALCRCGNRGCIEAYAGDYAIERRANGEDTGKSPTGMVHEPDLEGIAKRARAGDALALTAFREAGAAIGYGLANLFALVDPFPVAMVGSGTAGFDIMEPAIRDALDHTMGGRMANGLTIDHYLDEQPLMREGCAVSALFVLDEELADNGANGGK